MTILTGGLRYCKQTDCQLTTHPEDSPDFYPFCEVHRHRNPPYHEWRAEQRQMEALRQELL